MSLSAAHWVFFAVTIAMLFAMAVRRGVIILAMLGIVSLAILSPNAGDTLIDKAIFCAQAMFRAAIIGGSRLFDTILLVGFLGALLHVMRQEKIDRVMLAPFAKLMQGPRSSFLLLAFTSLFFSLFFWPTPVALMIGVCLVPYALKAGVSPLAAGMAISIAGYGAALSADPVVQAAARIAGAPGGVLPSRILPVSAVFAAVLAAVALGISVIEMKRIGRVRNVKAQSVAEPEAQERSATAGQKLLAFLIPAMLLFAALFSFFGPANAADTGLSVALLGGMAVLLLMMTCFIQHGTHALDSIVDMMTEGFFIVIRIFAPVVPVLGFFMLGNAASASQILGDGTPGYIAGIAAHFGLMGNIWALVATSVVVAVSAISARDGIAFTGLPLAGAIATMLSGGDANRAVILVSLAQVVTIWIGAGAYLHWSGVRTAAAQVGLDKEDLAAANRLPVIAGVVVVAIVAVLMLVRT